MNIIRARTAGFCMGVSLALQNLDNALELHGQGDAIPVHLRGRRIVTYGPIIHNPQVLSEYAEQGVLCTERLEDICPDDMVIIRAHGIPKTDEEALRAQGALISDATCPKVKRAQLSIRDATAEGQALLLFGEEDHPEVKGLLSYASGAVHVFGSLAELRTHTLDPKKAYVLAAQTTQDQNEFARISAWVQECCPSTPVLSTICNATRKRQDEALSIAASVEAMIVVGGKTSGNTRRLAALARECGVRTWHVESPEELPPEELKHTARVGLTAGASTPGVQIDNVQRFLERL